MNIEEKALNYAIGFFLSNYDNLTDEEVMESLQDEFSNVTVWEPFEHYDNEWIAEQIEMMAKSLVNIFGKEDGE